MIHITTVNANMTITPAGIEGEQQNVDQSIIEKQNQKKAAWVELSHGGSIAIGDNIRNPAKTKGSDALAIMSGAEVNGIGSIAIGHNSNAGYKGHQVDYAVALGKNTQVNAAGSIAIGYRSTVKDVVKHPAWLTQNKAVNSVVSFGSGKDDPYATRRLINIADGYHDHDAVTVRQIKAVIDSTQKNLGQSATIDKNGGLSWQSNIRDHTQLNITDAIQAAVAHVTSVSSNLMVKAELTAHGATNYRINISDTPSFHRLTTGESQLDHTGLHLNQGPSVLISGINAGNQKITQLMDGLIQIDSKDAVNGGQLAKIQQELNAQLQLKHHHLEGVKIDLEQVKNQIQQVENRAVHYDKTATGEMNHQLITFAGQQGTQLSNVADGKIALDSKDAVNGGQLASVRQDLNAQLQLKHHHLEGVKIDLDQVKNQIQQVENRAVHYDKTATGEMNHQLITFAGQQGTQLSNVADGKIALDSKDAVNGGQLASVRQDLNAQLQLKHHHLEGVKIDLDQVKNQIQQVENRTVHYDQTATGEMNHQLINFAGQQGTQLSNVADGKIALDSKDAINGGQVFTLGDQLQKQININRDDIKILKADLNHGGIGVITQDKNTTDIRVASSTGGQKIIMSGTDGNRLVTGVADGNIAKGSSDVVTANQLNISYEVMANALGGGAKFENGVATAPHYQLGYGDHQRSVNNIGDAIAALNDEDARLNHKVKHLADQMNHVVRSAHQYINEVEKNSKAAIASAIAIASLPQPVEKGSAMLAAGTGVWQGQMGVSMGASGMTEDKKIGRNSVNYIWKFASTTDSQGHWGGGASIGMQWK
ncbi:MULTISPECIES: YadA-like family protein [unclassified Acinetobacter]|uniref:YadA-like family protein n=1 Tax=unclassified Acinetobacter TaxID=196816 RepID=UPI0029349AFA|nr:MULTISPECIES: YadA-like family protein [unclassified Acinetobacter]WOE32408.1 YadA-like family protein [Acinetobacter sp. SAAs470]WOE37882.1 YadA-like family protein [Acinetobacter sp. SAAs474]